MTFLGTKEFYLEVSKGNVPGHRIEHRLGRNPDVDIGSTPEDIWAFGGPIIWQEAPSVIEVVSDNVGDNGVVPGLGAHIIQIDGLDANFLSQSEQVTLNGTTIVTTTNTFIRAHRMFVVEQGETYTGTNVGLILSQFASTGNPILEIFAGSGASEFAGHTIPANETGFLISASINADARSGKAITAVLKARLNADDVTSPYTGAVRHLLHLDGLIGSALGQLAAPTQVPSKTDIWWTILTVASNDTSVAGAITLIMIENELVPISAAGGLAI